MDVQFKIEFFVPLQGGIKITTKSVITKLTIPTGYMGNPNQYVRDNVDKLCENFYKDVGEESSATVLGIRSSEILTKPYHIEAEVKKLGDKAFSKLQFTKSQNVRGQQLVQHTTDEINEAISKKLDEPDSPNSVSYTHLTLPTTPYV